MKKYVVAAVTALMLFMGVRYSWLTVTGEVQPVLATWLIFSVAVSLSFWTYRASGKKSLVNNIANTVDLVVVSSLVGIMLCFGKGVRTNFTRFEICCLLVSGVILIAWKLSNWHEVSNLALQGVMTVAYFPTFYQLWWANSNTESYVVWTVSWVAALLAALVAIKEKDKLATVYAMRAFILVTIVLILMARIEIRRW